DGHPSHDATIHLDRADAGVELVTHTASAQVREPGIDPYVVGWPIEHPVGADAGLGRVEQELHVDVADRPGARKVRLGRNKRAGDTEPEEFLIGVRSLPGADEVPPADLLVLVQAPLRAAGQDLPDALAEEGDVLGRYAKVGAQPRTEIADESEQLRDCRWRNRRQLQRTAPEAREDGPGGIDQVICDGASASIRRPCHSVDDVLIEPWEEAKAVLTGQVPPHRGRKSAEVNRADILHGNRAG